MHSMHNVLSRKLETLVNGLAAARCSLLLPPPCHPILCKPEACTRPTDRAVALIVCFGQAHRNNYPS
jgi:hypothetical protein